MSLPRKTILFFPVTFLLLAIIACSTAQLPLGPRSSGSLTLSDPSIGLAALSSYQATLERSFTGTQGAQPDQWQDSWTLEVNQSPAGRLLTLGENGPSADQTLDGMIRGEINGVTYFRQNGSATCTATLASSSQGSAAIELAKFLPPVSSASAQSGTQTINGQATQQYHFDASGLNTASITASGDVWQSIDTHAVVRYILDVQGGAGYFGSGVSGSMHWDYELNQVNGTTDLEAPQGCPPGLVDAPLLSDAANVQKLPGLTTYTSNSTVASISQFYAQQLPQQKWQVLTQPAVGDAYASQGFQRGTLTLVVQISPAKDGGEMVALILQPTKAAGTISAITPGPTAVANTGGDAGKTVSQSLNLLLGIGSKTPVLPSYHMDVKGTSIKPPGPYVLSVDVQGANVHFHSQGGPAGNIEGYLIGAKDYLMQNGSVSDASGQARLAWVSWPLEIVSALGAASLGASPAGVEKVGGLEAQKYLLDSSQAPAGALSALQSFSTISAAKGTAWVDPQSGVLLRLVLDYTDGAKAQGSVDLTVSQVGAVTVSLP